MSSDLCQVEGELQLCYDDADVFLLTSKTATRGCQGLSATKPAIVTFEKKTITIMIHNCLIQDTVKIPASLEDLDGGIARWGVAEWIERPLLMLEVWGSNLGHSASKNTTSLP